MYYSVFTQFLTYFRRSSFLRGVSKILFLTACSLLYPLVKLFTFFFTLFIFSPIVYANYAFWTQWTDIFRAVQDVFWSIVLYGLCGWISHIIYNKMNWLLYIVIIFGEWLLYHFTCEIMTDNCKHTMSIDTGDCIPTTPEYFQWVLFYFSIKALLLCLLFGWLQRRKQKQII